MNLKERCYCVECTCFKCVNGIAPSYLFEVLTPAASINRSVNRSNTDNRLCYMCYMSNVSYISNIFSTGRRRSGTPYLHVTVSHLRNAPCVSDFKKLGSHADGKSWKIVIMESQGKVMENLFCKNS